MIHESETIAFLVSVTHQGGTNCQVIHDLVKHLRTLLGIADSHMLQYKVEDILLKPSLRGTTRYE
jgi:hypothetical protein